MTKGKSKERDPEESESPAIFQMKSSKPSKASQPAEEASNSDPKTGKPSLDSDMEEALRGENFYSQLTEGYPEVQIDLDQVNSPSSKDESPESTPSTEEQPGTEEQEVPGPRLETPRTTELPTAKTFHLLVIPPAGSPIYETSNDVQELLVKLYNHLEIPLLLMEVAAWQAFIFEGSRLPIIGDLAKGFLAVKHGDEVVELPAIDFSSEDELPAGQLFSAVEVKSDNRSGSGGGFGDIDDDDSGLDDVF